MTPKASDSDTNQDAPQRTTPDELLLRLLKMPPQPRPKRERGEFKGKPNKKG